MSLQRLVLVSSINRTVKASLSLSIVMSVGSVLPDGCHSFVPASLPSIELKFPDDLLLEQIFLKQFLDKGVKVEKEVISFLLKRVDRSFDSVYNLVSKIDFASLEKSRKITIPFVKKYLEED